MNDKKQDGSKKNSWKIIIVLILIFAVFKSCGNGCKEKGCHDEVYKDGYCRTHFALHKADEYLDGYF